MVLVNDLKFDKDGLIPAVVVDCLNQKVLMLAYMNKESLEISIKEGKTCFYSRSRKKLWRKGEESGNYQHIVTIRSDCDNDTLIIMVKKDGPACHNGTETCFNESLYKNSDLASFSIDSLYRLINGRKADIKEESYTSYLFQKGRDKILKKIGEEATEVIIGGKADDKKETIYEIADLAYHVLVLMADMDISPDEIRGELCSRHIIDKKVKQEKMT